MTTTHAVQLGQAPFSIPPALAQGGLRLVTFLPFQNLSPRIGVVLDDGRVADIAQEAEILKMILSFDPHSMLSLIASGEMGMVQIKLIVDSFKKNRNQVNPINEVKLLSPIPRPHSNIYCIGWNYLEHFEEGLNARADKGVKEYPQNPVVFTKAVNTMNGPFDAIPYDGTNSIALDWEVELAIVIGTKGKNISEANAMSHVFGYTAYNDTTCRDVQQKRHGGQWFKGKSLDGHGPMGPWIVPAESFNPDNVRLICRVNGVEKQNGTTEQMYFKIPRIIAELSRGLTLEAGDIIATGTPPGVGYSRTPAEFLKPGDVMESEVEGLGCLRNLIVAE